MREKLSWALVIVLSMTLGGAAVVGVDSLREGEQPVTTVIERASPGTGIVVESVTGDVADLYDAVRPTIVQITGQNGRTGGSGSGIILDTQGHILTNNHVISGMDQIDVILADGSSGSARVIGRDPGNDLAVIRADLPPSRLRAAVLGDSDAVRTGEFVIAVGNPFGIEGSLTQGIVSGVGRTLADGRGRPLRQLIQSDAAINPGNSGGALFNSRGEVIGITTAIENPSGDRTFVGIGYAVPINAARRFLPEMLAGKLIEHPRMGVALQNVTPALAARFGLTVDAGVLITSTEPGTAATRAGLRGGTGGGRGVGDVVIEIDGQEIRTFDDLASYIDSREVGDRIAITNVRDGAQMSVELTLEAWSEPNA